MKIHSHEGAAQQGFSLTELTISTALSLGVIASVLTGYLALSTSAMDTLAAGKLNQDVGAVLSLMANELRRASHTGAASNAPNPFALLAVFDDMQSNLRQSSTGSGSCIVYAYDANGDGSVTANELAGFRLTGDGAVQMRMSGNIANPNSCSSQGASWIALTDPDAVTATALRFDFAHSTCANASEPDGVDDEDDGAMDDADEADCYAQPPAEGDIRVEQTDIAITLSAQLAHDAFVRLTQTQRVRLRNAFVRRQ